MPYKSKYCLFFITPIMKVILILLFVCVTAHISFAQDSTKARSLDTIALKPFFGLGLINGTRVGAQIQYGDIIALELGAGFDFFLVPRLLIIGVPYKYLTLSQGLIFTPFPEKRLSLILYNAYLSDIDQSGFQRYWQYMIGWSIPLGEFTHSRLSFGRAVPPEGGHNLYGFSVSDAIINFDFVMTFDHHKIRF